MNKNIETLSINAIRNLCIDMVENANSGHPGMPMGAATIAYTLWQNHLRVSPKNEKWLNRDRFVLSSGHASSLLYSLIHLSGFDLKIEDLKQFRQLHSKTPGHPEYTDTVGIDATTGPLGQGLAMATGMALSESYLNAKYNKKEVSLIDHYTYVLCGDGDMMEGISSEAASFAGHNGLDKLIVIYDANEVTLDGQLSQSFSEDVGKRHEAYGWDVHKVEYGNSVKDINESIVKAKNNKEKPSLIIVNTTIGYGAPNKSGTHKVHGSPLGAEERDLAREYYGWDHDAFVVPEEVYRHMDKVTKGEDLYNSWIDKKEIYKKDYPLEFKELFASEYVDSNLEFADSTIATRDASHQVINEIVKNNSNFIGGSADLSSSNKTYMNDQGDYSRVNRTGKNIWYGVREFAMAAMSNGITLHGGLRNYSSTFLVFSDYLRPAMRLSSLMKIPTIYVFTHDSIAVGEDGPTHEPVEHLQSLRLIPNSYLFRPADAKETQAAWNFAMKSSDTPVSLALSRQNLPVLSEDVKVIEEGVSKGAYIIASANNPVATIIATGSEVSLALNVVEELKKEKIDINVVSMPCVELFEKQTNEYKKSVMVNDKLNTFVLEMGVTRGWERYAENIYGIDKFGASAPFDKLIEEYGFTTEKVKDYIIEKIREK